MNSKTGVSERKNAEAVITVLVLSMMMSGAAKAQDSGSSESSSSSSFGSSDSGSSFGSSGGSDSGSSFGSSSGESSAPATGTTGGAKEKTAAELEAPNALRGLFTPQPQYPSPGKTIMNPETMPSNLGDDSKQPGRQPSSGNGTIYSNDFGKHETTEAETKNKDNPLKGLFQQQPQYPSPGKTIMFPEAVPKHVGDDGAVPGRNPGQAGTIYSDSWGKDTTEPSGNKDNVLKGLFVQQPQYPSPNKTIMYPDNTPKQLGDDGSEKGKQPGQAGAVYRPPTVPTLEEEAAAAAAAALKTTPAAETKSSETEKKEGEKDGDKKDADSKDEDKKDAKKDADKKDGDKKDADKKDSDKKDTDKKDGDKKDGDKKDSDKKDSDKKDTDKKDTDKKDSILSGLDEKKSDEKKGTADEKKSEDKKADTDKDKDNKTEEKKDEKKDEKKLEPKAEAYHPIREAIILMNAKNYKASSEILNNLIAKNPGYAQAIYTRAVLHVMLRQYDKAVADYNTVLKMIPVGGELRTLAEKGLNKLHFQNPYAGK